jgi:hypothetical protein
MVSAAGLCLAGMALIWFGGREERAAPLIAGAMLVSLAASCREVALPLAAIVPVTMLAATAPGRPIPWRRLVGVNLLAGVLLLPRAAMILQAKASKPEAAFLVTMPHLPFNRLGEPDLKWVGWSAPYLPAWLGWLMLVAFATLLVHSIVRRDWRTGLIGIGAVVVAQVQGGLVGVNGWFPSAMRHQYLAMALWMLPCGWLCGAPLDWLARAGARWAAIAGGVAVPLAGLATLVATPSSYRVDAPITREYRFLRDTVPHLASRARAVYVHFDDVPMSDLLRSWLAGVQPRWQVVSSDELLRSGPPTDGAPTYLFLDRVCFINRACFAGMPLAGHCYDPDVRDAQPSVATPWGRLHPKCQQALAAFPWTEIARREIDEIRPTERNVFDLPSLDAKIRIAILEWKR